MGIMICPWISPVARQWWVVGRCCSALSEGRLSEGQARCRSWTASQQLAGTFLPGFRGSYSLLVLLLRLTQMHWLDLDSEPLERFAIHKGCLIRCREPGFVVQGFLWCNNKLRPQLHKDDKRAYRLTGDWGDKATMKIVSCML
jgi:hypothetical protein